VVRRAASLHHHPIHLAVIEPALKLCTRQTCPLDDLPARIGKREFEDVLCKVNSNGSSIHFGLLLSLVSLTPPNDSAWHDDAAERAGGVHPIIQADVPSARRLSQTLGSHVLRGEVKCQVVSAYSCLGFCFSPAVQLLCMWAPMQPHLRPIRRKPPDSDIQQSEPPFPRYEPNQE